MALIERWAHGFDERNVVVRLYDKALLFAGTIADLLNVVGLDDYAEAYASPTRRRRANVSPGNDIIRAIRYINATASRAPVWANGVLNRMRSAVLRGTYGTNLILWGVSPVLNGPLITPEDEDWLRRKTNAWNEPLWGRSLDPADRAFLEF